MHKRLSLTKIVSTLTCCLVSSICFADNTLFEYPLEERFPASDRTTPYQVTVVFDKEVIPKFDYQHQPPQITAIRLYENANLLQEITMEVDKQPYYPNSYPIWPSLKDLNFDGYPDISFSESQGSLGNFYEYWIYNPELKRFEGAIVEGDDLVNPYHDARHKLVISSASTRRAHESNVLLQRWQGNKLMTVDSANGYFLPIKRDDELLYCEVVVSYDEEKGEIAHSLKVELLPNGNLQLHGVLPHEDKENAYRYDMCIDDAGIYSFSANQAKVNVWVMNEGQLENSKSIAVTQWVQSKDEHGKLMNEWCPAIPYADLDNNKISTFVLDYPSEQTELKLCRAENPLQQSQ